MQTRRRDEPFCQTPTVYGIALWNKGNLSCFWLGFSAIIDPMFEVDAELAAMLAWDDAFRAELPDDDEVPDWVIADLPASELTAGQRIDRLVSLERRIVMLQAEQTRVLVVIDRADVSTEHWCQEAVMCALRVSATAAQTRLKTARTLTDELPRTLAALESGSISVRHAEVIADASWKLEPDVGTEFESLVLQRAAEQSLPELRRSIKRAALRVDPATAETRHQQARQDRCVRKTALADGMAELRLIPTAEHLETAWLRLDAGVRLLPADPASRSWYPPTPCSASTTNPDTSPATARSPPTPPAAWPRRKTLPG
jgi:hypothetical protein